MMSPDSIEVSTSERFVAVVMVDIVDFTEMDNERQAWCRLKLESWMHRAATSERTGSLYETQGDGGIMCFDTPPAALRALFRLLALIRAEWRWPGAHPSLRAALTAGSVVEGARHGKVKLNGNAMNEAGRLISIAQKGQVLLSATVHEDVRHRVLREPRPISDPHPDQPPTANAAPVDYRSHGFFWMEGIRGFTHVWEAALEGNFTAPPEDSKKMFRVPLEGLPIEAGDQPRPEDAVPGGLGWYYLRMLGKLGGDTLWLIKHRHLGAQRVLRLVPRDVSLALPPPPVTRDEPIEASPPRSAPQPKPPAAAPTTTPSPTPVEPKPASRGSAVGSPAPNPPASTRPPPPDSLLRDTAAVLAARDRTALAGGIPATLSIGGVEFALVPEGRFEIPGLKKNDPRTLVQLEVPSPFYISVEAFEPQHALQLLDSLAFGSAPAARRPSTDPQTLSAHLSSVLDALQRLSRRTGITHRLPTEAQWCLALWSGMQETHARRLAHAAPNPLGIRVPNGEWWEWTSSRYGHLAPEAQRHAADPQSSELVIRGGTPDDSGFPLSPAWLWSRAARRAADLPAPFRIRLVRDAINVSTASGPHALSLRTSPRPPRAAASGPPG